jgi:hypothetical protein
MASATSLYRQLLRLLHTRAATGLDAAPSHAYLAAEFRRPAASPADAQMRLLVASDYVRMTGNIQHHQVRSNLKQWVLPAHALSTTQLVQSPYHILDRFSGVAAHLQHWGGR